MEKALSLESVFPPCGDQPVAIAELVDGLASGESFQTLLGDGACRSLGKGG